MHPLVFCMNVVGSVKNVSKVSRFVLLATNIRKKLSVLGKPIEAPLANKYTMADKMKWARRICWSSFDESHKEC